MCKPNFLSYGLIIKKQLLNEMHDASVSHRRFARQIDHLVHGLPINVKTLPATLNESVFSEWYYGRFIQLKKFTRLQKYTRNIQEIYKELDVVYQTIHSIYTTQPKNTWIHSVMNQQARSKEYKNLQQHYSHFETLSKELLLQLNMLENMLAIQPIEEHLLYT
ncbi:MAG: hypothetical protein PHO27_07175 [Sulfuricurvum sp.]|nr:hypothetical protein [Sulfuricurvum sp.]